MNVSEARTLLNANVLTKATLYRSEDSSGWLIKFEATQPVGTSLVLETQKGYDRVFKTSDAAILTLCSIGFEAATIDIPINLTL